MIRAARAVALALLLTACGAEPAARIEDTAAEAPREPAAPEATEVVADEPAPGQAAPPAPDFEAPLPEEACPTTLVRLAHREGVRLPPRLTQGVAFRSEDGRHVRVVLSDHAIRFGANARIDDPAPGHARFEMEAIRQRRRPLEPRVLGGPDSLRGGLSHARIVSSGPLLTFGHREVGTVELTRVDEEQVCGRIDLNDGFGRVRGGFTVPVTGPLPP